jgi:hypothetical protein
VGVNYIFVSLPMVPDTPEVRQELNQVIDRLDLANLPEETLWELGLEVDEELPDADQVRTAVRELVQEYFNQQASREVTVENIEGVAYLTTGGLSWGDAPTEAFNVFSAVLTVAPLYDRMQEIASRDWVRNLSLEARRSQYWIKVAKTLMAYGQQHWGEAFDPLNDPESLS